MLCPNCQTDNRDGAKFCDECGFPLAGASGVVEAAQHEDAGDGAGDAASDAEPVLDGLDVEVSDDLYELAVGDEPPASDEPAPASATQELYDLQQYAPKPGDDDFEASIDEFGERVVDSGYEAPKANWRDGNTMQMKPVDGAEPEKSKDYLASSTTKQRNGKKVAAIAAGVVAVAAVAVAVATFQMNLWGGKPVPDVRGMTEADATSVLQDEGFVVRASQVKSDDTEGLVLITDPEAGGRANEGDEVVIHIAAGRVVPDVVGKTEAEAAELLGAEEFENVKFEKKRSDKKKGTVLSIKPEAGTRAKSTAEITVTVAEPYTVPDVIDKYLDQAIKAIQDAGLKYEVVYITTDDYADGTMLGTEPAAGTEVKGGSLVYIQISQARGAYLEDLARSYLAPGTVINSNGYEFSIDSLDSVSYSGDGTVSYTVTARPFTSLAGETVYGSPQTFDGTLVFDENDQVVS